VGVNNHQLPDAEFLCEHCDFGGLCEKYDFLQSLQNLAQDLNFLWHKLQITGKYFLSNQVRIPLKDAL
jgi:hypothetical protein